MRDMIALQWSLSLNVCLKLGLEVRGHIPSYTANWSHPLVLNVSLFLQRLNCSKTKTSMFPSWWCCHHSWAAEESSRYCTSQMPYTFMWFWGKQKYVKYYSTNTCGVTYSWHACIWSSVFMASRDSHVQLIRSEITAWLRPKARLWVNTAGSWQRLIWGSEIFIFMA